jgi:hypothetical protein
MMCREMNRYAIRPPTFVIPAFLSLFFSHLCLRPRSSLSLFLLCYEPVTRPEGGVCNGPTDRHSLFIYLTLFTLYISILCSARFGQNL